MHKLEDIIRQMKNLIPVNRVSVTIFVVCIIALILGGIRACSNNSSDYSHHTFVIARDPTGYPLDFGGKDPSVIAFTNDLLLTIASRRGVNIEIISISYNNLYDGLDASEYAAVISSMEPTPLNARFYNFSDPFFLIGPVLIVPKESDIHTLKDLDNHIIGVKSGEILSLDLTEYSAYYMFYDTISSAFTDLHNGRIDGIVMPVMQALTYITTFYPNSFKVVTSPLTNDGLRLVTRKTPMTEYLIGHFNEGLEELISDGTYSNLLKKWGLTDPFPRKVIPSPKK